MGCDSIATTISRMGKEPGTLGLEDLKGHCFSAFRLTSSKHFFRFWLLASLSACKKDKEFREVFS